MQITILLFACFLVSIVGQYQEVYTFGQNSYGELGQVYKQPNLIPGLTNIASMAGGYYHVLFLNNQGIPYALGSNDYGQLGFPDGDTNPRSQPTLVGGLPNIVSVVTSTFYSFFLNASGNAVGCGWNFNGQLGLGYANVSQQGVVAIPLNNISSISAGYSHAMYLLNNGDLFTAGSNLYGALGVNATIPYLYSPQKILSNITKVSCGWFHTLAITNTGQVYVWGLNSVGALGLGFISLQEYPQIHPTLRNITDVTCGVYGSFVLSSNGTAWSFGANTYGELGLGTSGTVVSIPTAIPLSGFISQIAYSEGHSLILNNQGRVFSTGRNYNGELGTGNFVNQVTPTGIVFTFQSPVSMIIAGPHYSMMLSQSLVYTIGGMTGVSTLSPKAIFDLQGGTKSILGNYYETFAFDSTSWFASGYNVWGQLGFTVGLTDVINRYVPRASPTLTNFKDSKFILGFYHTLMITTQGSVYGVGSNLNGEMGYPPTILPSATTATPLPFYNNVTIQGIGGQYFSAVLTTNGTVWVMGSGQYGNLGQGDVSDRWTPTRFPVNNVINLWGGGFNFVFAQTSDGTVWASGRNEQGALGVGDLVNKVVPTRVGLDNIVTMWSGYANNYFLVTNGSMYGCGENVGRNLGLGLGDYFVRSLPTFLPNVQNVSRMAIGQAHTLMLSTNGTLWGWGDNSYGQIGLGYTSIVGVPMVLTQFANPIEIAANGLASIVLNRCNSSWSGLQCQFPVCFNE
jgi:alpha-tubulin suppressor-like RCC1 family protein